jgi:hypothetical protein
VIEVFKNVNQQESINKTSSALALGKSFSGLQMLTSKFSYVLSLG